MEYKRADVNNYICDDVRPLYVLYVVLKAAKKGKENWYSQDYDSAIKIKDFEARDK